MTLDELARETGLTPRTIRFYIGQGIVPAPRNRGRGASYDSDHLAALRRVIELRAQRFRLEEIRSMLGGGVERTPLERPNLESSRLEESADGWLEGRPDTHAGDSVRQYISQALAQRAGTPPAPPRAFTRHDIVDGVELHIATTSSRDETRIVDEAMRDLRAKLLAHRSATGRKIR